MISRSVYLRVAAWTSNLAVLAAIPAWTTASHAQTPVRATAEDAGATRAALDRFLALKHFYVRVGDRCEEFQGQQKAARHHRQGPLGTVETEIGWESLRRIGPIERLRGQIDALASARRPDDRDVGGVALVSCWPKPSASWFESKADCESLRPGAGIQIPHCVIAHLTEEGIRHDDEMDARVYEQTSRELRDAEQASKKRMAEFKQRLVAAKAVYQRTPEGCLPWQIRTDPGSLSGWLFRDETSPARRVEIRFAARVYSFDMDGPLITVFPSLLESPVGFGTRSCHWETTLAEVSSTRLRFNDQTWYLSKQACVAAPQPAPRAFGPNCK